MRTIRKLRTPSPQHLLSSTSFPRATEGNGGCSQSVTPPLCLLMDGLFPLFWHGAHLTGCSPSWIDPAQASLRLQLKNYSNRGPHHRAHPAGTDASVWVPRRLPPDHLLLCRLLSMGCSSGPEPVPALHGLQLPPDHTPCSIVSSYISGTSWSPLVKQPPQVAFQTSPVPVPLELTKTLLFCSPASPIHICSLTLLPSQPTIILI